MLCLRSLSHLPCAPRWHPAFNWPLPDHMKRHKWEHVERFSARLIVALRDLLDLRISAYGEVFESSVCAALSWCTSANLALDGFIRHPYSTAQYNGSPMVRLCFDRGDTPEVNSSSVWTHKWVCSCSTTSPRNRLAVDDAHRLPRLLPAVG